MNRKSVNSDFISFYKNTFSIDKNTRFFYYILSIAD